MGEIIMIKNKSKMYVAAEQACAMRPKSSDIVSAVEELNYLNLKYEFLMEKHVALAKAACRTFLARGCGCCADYDERDESDKELGIALGAKPYDDESGYDIYTVAYKLLDRPDPSERE